MSAKQVLLTIFLLSAHPRSIRPISNSIEITLTSIRCQRINSAPNISGKVKEGFQVENTFGLTTELYCPGYPSEPSLLPSHWATECSPLKANLPDIPGIVFPMGLALQAITKKQFHLQHTNFLFGVFPPSPKRIFD